ncbi:cobalt ABC transporter CbiQ, inner membrane subunit, partial [groundwater metagenome]
RSYEQGERTFQSMLSRGYDYTADIYVHKKKILMPEIVFVALTIFVVGSIHLLG